MKIDLELIKPDSTQVGILFDFLKKRNHKISHAQMPNYDEHRSFVKNNPYVAWYLVKSNESYMGSVYITDQNTIGINIMEEFMPEAISPIISEITKTHHPLPEIKSIRAPKFSVNVSPGNLKLINALQSHGCKLVQLTYTIN